MEYYKPEPILSQEADTDPFEESIQRLDIDSNLGVRHHVNQCLKMFGPKFPVILVAQGKGIPKAVSCAEIVKARKTDCQIHQANSVGFIKITETYEPVLSGLESIRVTRTVPSLHILLSEDPIDPNTSGKLTGRGKNTLNMPCRLNFLHSEQQDMTCPNTSGVDMDKLATTVPNS